MAIELQYKIEVTDEFKKEIEKVYTYIKYNLDNELAAKRLLKKI